MNDNLNENKDKENEDNIEKFETDEDQKKDESNKKGIDLIKIFLFIIIIILIGLIVYLCYFRKEEKEPSEKKVEKKKPKNPFVELTNETKCKTYDENKKQCTSCYPGDALKNGKCYLNHSFKAVYSIDTTNESVKLFSIPKHVILEMQVDSNNIDPNDSFKFDTTGEHTIYVLLDMKRVLTLNGIFTGNKKLISIEFTPLFKTDRINEMSMMFQNCAKLKSVDVSHFNTKNVEYMDY